MEQDLQTELDNFYDTEEGLHLSETDLEYFSISQEEM